MPRLLNRQKQIPNGYRFYIPRLRWQSPKNASFEVIVMSAIAALMANRRVADILKWDLSHDAMADRVDEYNAKICEANGWNDFIVQPVYQSLPKLSPRDQQIQSASLKAAVAAAKELVSGAKTLMEWIDSGEPPVEPEAAEARATVCSTCPKNEPGDFTRWFTVPAAELIKRQVEKAQSRKLTTGKDGALHLCTACHCPLKLKVHVPIHWITTRLSSPQMAKLREAPACWIISEMQKM